MQWDSFTIDKFGIPSYVTKSPAYYKMTKKIKEGLKIDSWVIAQIHFRKIKDKGKVKDF